MKIQSNYSDAELCFRMNEGTANIYLGGNINTISTSEEIQTPSTFNAAKHGARVKNVETCTDYDIMLARSCRRPS